MQQPRAQRFNHFIPFDFEYGPNRDVYRYTPDGKSFKLEIWPRLSTGFPKFEITVPTKFKVPDTPYYTRGGLLQLEVNDRPFFILCYGLGRMNLYPDKHLEESEYQMIACIADQSGKIVKTVIGPRGDFSDFGEQFAHFALKYMEFRESAKPMDKGLKTEIEPIDPETLTHHFVATATMPGGGVVKIRKPVKDIREAGKKPDSNFQYWNFGYSWQSGDLVAFIGQDFTGRYHEQVFQNGTLVKENHSSDFLQIILSAASSLNV